MDKGISNYEMNQNSTYSITSFEIGRKVASPANCVTLYESPRALMSISEYVVHIGTANTVLLRGTDTRK